MKLCHCEADGRGWGDGGGGGGRQVRGSGVVRRAVSDYSLLHICLNCDIFAAIRKEHTTDDRILASVHACRRAASRRELRNRGQEPQSESVVTDWAGKKEMKERKGRAEIQGRSTNQRTNTNNTGRRTKQVSQHRWGNVQAIVRNNIR